MDIEIPWDFVVLQSDKILNRTPGPARHREQYHLNSAVSWQLVLTMSTHQNYAQSTP